MSMELIMWFTTRTLSWFRVREQKLSLCSPNFLSATSRYENNDVGGGYTVQMLATVPKWSSYSMQYEGA